MLVLVKKHLSNDEYILREGDAYCGNGYACVIQSMTVLYDVMATYLAEQNRNDSSDWVINGSRFTSVTFIALIHAEDVNIVIASSPVWHIDNC